MSAPMVTVERHRLIRAMAHTPYGAGLPVKIELDGDALIGWLEALAARLEEQGRLARERTEELEKLRRQRDAVRAFLGLKEGE